MAAEGRNSWKIFGIVIIALVIAAAIAAAAFFIGRSSDSGESQAPTVTRQTTPVGIPVNDVPQESGGGTDGAATTTGAATTERYVIGEGEGATPCIGGFRTVTHTTNWSDGTTDTTSVTEPCTP